MDGYEQRTKNDQRGLAWINAFGGLRTAELGRLMWPNAPYSRTRADRATRSWLERGLVLARPLPDGAGRLLVLAEPGARWLRNEGVEARSGKDIGETLAGAWIAPASWKHDLMAAGVLVDLYEKGYEIQPEREIRKRNPTLTKIPDGLAWHPERPNASFWLEIESARKSGKNMLELASALCRVSDGNSPPVSGIRPTCGLVAFVPSASDERNYRLNHRARVTAGIRRTATSDVTVSWAVCTLLGCGVSQVSLEEERITAAPADRLLKVMRAITWTDDETGVLSAHYGACRFYIWEDESMGWTYQLNENPARQAGSKSDALRGCARLLSEDMAASKSNPL